jgi:hypothetical protein
MDTIVTIRSIEDGCAVLAGIRPNAPSRRVLLANLDAQFRPLYAHEQEALEAYLANAELAEQPASFEAWEVKACPGCKQLVYESGAHRCSDGSGRTVYPEHLKTIWAVPQPVTD